VAERPRRDLPELLIGLVAIALALAIASGLGADLGAVRKVDLGVYQIVPRNSTEVSDYGINDTGSREKEVVSVVTVTFAVDR
jgi:uncharacterized protein